MATETLHPEQKLFVAFDYSSIDSDEAQEMLEVAGKYRVGVKIGTQITMRDDWVRVVDEAQMRGAHVFADTKANDISNTVAESLACIMEQGPSVINMHANAGVEAMEAFVNVRDKSEAISNAATLAVAVTVLTSKTPEEIYAETGRTPEEQTLFYAKLAIEAGMDGVVASAKDLALFRTAPELEGSIKITPGIRPVWAISNDQKRVLTPKAALAAGATHLVVGRPITQPPKGIDTSVNAIEAILEEMN